MITSFSKTFEIGHDFHDHFIDEETERQEVKRLAMVTQLGKGRFLFELGTSDSLSDLLSPKRADYSSERA